MNTKAAEKEVDASLQPAELTKEGAVRYIKAHRKNLDTDLQLLKETKGIFLKTANDQFLDKNEVIAQTTLAQRAVEEAIMRLGMALKYTGQPDPYPESKNPASLVVEPTADNLKL